jgi:ATP-dependent protease ClpP protease subunit
MNKVVLTLLVAAALLLTYPAGKKVLNGIRNNAISQEETNPAATEIKLPVFADLLGISTPAKVSTVKNTLTLEAKNTVVFRGPVTRDSVGKAIQRISEVSRNLSKSDKIYLVLDTPGGSIFDGMDFIDFLEGLPQEVKTVTLFSASMGFQIVENNPGERLIARNGVLMSHRATGGMEGQFNGEFETRYKMVKRKIDYLDTVSANRVKQSFEQYQKTIKDEWWVHGFDAVDAKIADKMILLECGKSMEGTEDLIINTMFGPIRVIFDKCPLVKEPVGVEMAGIQQNAKPYVSAIVRELFYEKEKFVRDIIMTNKFYSIFN